MKHSKNETVPPRQRWKLSRRQKPYQNPKVKHVKFEVNFVVDTSLNNAKQLNNERKESSGHKTTTGSVRQVKRAQKSFLNDKYPLFRLYITFFSSSLSIPCSFSLAFFFSFLIFHFSSLNF